MVIPLPLIPYILDQRLSAKDAITTIFLLLQSLDLADEWAPLLDFLVVATIYRVDRAVPNTIQDALWQVPVQLYLVIKARQDDILLNHFPALSPQEGGQHPA